MATRHRRWPYESEYTASGNDAVLCCVVLLHFSTAHLPLVLLVPSGAEHEALIQRKSGKDNIPISALTYFHAMLCGYASF
ncbi:unnamed protein product [Soboliphyme baturini]|uniref:Secreted protein n=1 Tax=Soboliphyme baturini TaxID=241478 RepID=A0A183INA4_9BILA|nr:unnamed protein product [Soboliphyme baturini]